MPKIEDHAFIPWTQTFPVYNSEERGCNPNQGLCLFFPSFNQVRLIGSNTSRIFQLYSYLWKGLTYENNDHISRINVNSCYLKP